MLVAAVVAVAIVVLLARGGADEAGTPPEPTATATATPSPTQTPSPSPTVTPSPSPSATPAPSNRRTAPFIGDRAGSVVRRLRARGYDVTLAFSSSTAGTPAPGTVYAIDPSPLPAPGGEVRVIAQPTG